MSSTLLRTVHGFQLRFSFIAETCLWRSRMNECSSFVHQSYNTFFQSEDSSIRLPKHSLRPWLLYSLFCLPCPCLSPSDVFYFSLSTLTLFLQPSCLHNPSPDPYSSYLLFSLLFNFFSKCCFHYFVIHSLHNLYKLTLVPVFLLSVVP